jgi:uncharacterized protein (TIGR01777 family)
VRIVAAGATGFLGAPLVAALQSAGHDVLVLTRRPRAVSPFVTWTPDGSAGRWAAVMDAADAVINLAGANLAGRRWTARRKRLITESRLNATRSLVRAVERADRPPRVFLSGSAVGYYGPHGEESVTEGTPPGRDFLACVTRDWEAEATPLAGAVRLIWLRTGLPLAADGGVLGRMLPIYRVGLGGPFGSGTQYVPWIHRADWIRLVLWLLATETAAAAFNASAPDPVRNLELSATLADVLGRPHLMRVPAFALRAALGEVADALLTGQRAVPAHALALGFRFNWPTIRSALVDLLGRKA